MIFQHGEMSQAKPLVQMTRTYTTDVENGLQLLEQSFQVDDAHGYSGSSAANSSLLSLYFETSVGDSCSGVSSISKIIYNKPCYTLLRGLDHDPNVSSRRGAQSALPTNTSCCHDAMCWEPFWLPSQQLSACIPAGVTACSKPSRVPLRWHRSSMVQVTRECAG